MVKNFTNFFKSLTFFVCFLFFISSSVSGQEAPVRGLVLDEYGNPVPGASISVKGTSIGAITNEKGHFQIDKVSSEARLIISVIGYDLLELSVSALNAKKAIVLKESSQKLDETVVTGVFDRRKKIESSVAITTLNRQQLQMLVPNSAADLLKNVPGVYVNSSMGEVRNVVYSRGVSANSVGGLVTPVNGFYYVSLQEDGLPVAAVSGNELPPDLFYRADITLNRLEAVRGGTSSITSANAPGGIFNYMSRTGGSTFSGEVRTRFGLEGNGANPYYRTDLTFGGPLKNDSWKYNVGGFYRHAQGAKYAGYPVNKGGQIKASVSKEYSSGSFNFYTKYLNDHNGSFLALPALGFEDVKLPEGVDKTDSYYLPKGSASVPNGAVDKFVNFNTTTLRHSKDAVFGLKWDHKLDNGWSFCNNIKYSSKSLFTNTSEATNFTYLNDPSTFFLLGLIGPPMSPAVNLPGTLILKNRVTGQTLAEVEQSFGLAPNGQPYPIHTVKSNSLNSSVPNAVLYHGTYTNDTKVNELMNLFTVNKRLKNGSINAGAFYANSTVTMDPNMPASLLALSAVENRPSPLDVSFQAITGQTYQVSNPEGYIKLGGGYGFYSHELTQDQIAFFVGNNLTFIEKLNVDWGVRFENTNVKGLNNQTVPNRQIGGIDGNPLTTYDNFYTVSGEDVSYNKNLNSFSFSAGVNYRFNPNNALYIRYSNGQKSPDMVFYNSYTSKYAVENQKPINQNIIQLELGYKFKHKLIDLVATPFYSKLSNVSSRILAADETSTFYYTPLLYNSVETQGLELETNIKPIRNFSIRGVFTVQKAKYLQLKTWDVGQNGKADDKIMDYTGNKAENNPDFLFTVTPTYTLRKFFSFLQWKYMGDRPANHPNAFDLPGFHQLDLGLGYSPTAKLSFNFNINNLTDKLGIMGWAPPGGIVESFSPQNFTKEKLNANPNAVYRIMPIQPRAYFFSAAYKF